MDEEIEKRLNKLRGNDETNDSQRIKEEPEPLKYNTFVKKTIIPIQAKNETNVEESRTKNPEVKDIKSDKVEVLDDRTDTNENKTILSSFDSDAFDAKQQFNDWFENKIAMKKKKPKKKLKPNEVLANASKTEDIYMHKMNENLEYKQKKFPDSSLQ